MSKRPILGYAALLVYFESDIIVHSVHINQPSTYKYLPYIATPYSSYLKKGRIDIFNITLDIYEKAIGPKFLFYFTGGNNTFSNTTIRFIIYKNQKNIFISEDILSPSLVLNMEISLLKTLYLRIYL